MASPKFTAAVTQIGDADAVLNRMPPLIMGGAGFSYQLHPDPKSLPAVKIIKRAFDLGLRAIDTSPYYEPSEQLMGAALCDQEITSHYQRSDYILMTKVGRIAEKKFDYSPEWVRKSVARSLQRFGTSYLDVVFCHDVEFVSIEEAVEAVGALVELSANGSVKCIGISGYSIPTLLEVAERVRKRYHRPIDVVQNWAQLTLQNTQLERTGLAEFRRLGVRAVCSSSPLAVGLLRNGGVPLGALGNWHPAPPDMRVAAQRAAEWVEDQGDTLSAVALRFAITKAQQNCIPGFTVSTITGISSISEVEANITTAEKLLQESQSFSGSDSPASSSHSDRSPDWSAKVDLSDADAALYEGVRKILGKWLDYDFSAPPKSEREADRGLKADQSRETSPHVVEPASRL